VLLDRVAGPSDLLSSPGASPPPCLLDPVLTRVSTLSGGRRYLHAILEAEARLAALTVGADPLRGFLHADRRFRDSLACDLMEPVRPLVEGNVLDSLARREFRKTDFFECADGQCRLLPPLTHELIATAPTWGRALLPVAQDLAIWLTETKIGDTQRPVDGSRSPARPLGERGVSTRPTRASGGHARALKALSV
jgi:hypothetical protein